MSVVLQPTDRDAALAVAGLLVCNSAAVLAALVFNRPVPFEHPTAGTKDVQHSVTVSRCPRSLSLEVLQDSSLAARATLLFCLTPASVFYSAIYTESLFALLSFAGMLWAGRRPWLATAAFALATATRSNGAQAAQAPDDCECIHLVVSP